ncbi:MAG: MBL fold metallo-hydrolase [Actinomycetota bacterium]|jgi:beta-lactamase superfamily II metal-dependent hydrolase|nr:MBL fold metallo-hydrolase [Actinomycetota bacterium]
MDLLSDAERLRIERPSIVFQKGLTASLLLVLILLTPACAELELLTGGARGGPDPPPSGSLSVSFIDVGQGDSVLVQAGGESYLIDAGRPEEGPNVVDFLRGRGVDSLDGIVVSNPDADHIGGFLDVFDAFPVETVYVSGDPNSTLTYNTFLRGVSDEGAQTEVLRTGALMDWGGVRADIIAPPTEAEGGLFSEINDNSVAILLTYGTARILLAGDAEADEEEYMANGAYTGPLTILKVTHHGSNTSSTPLFLSRFPPKAAVIQCGADNPYGHPTPETLERLQRAGAKVFRNDEDGDVIATIKDQELNVAVTKR